MVLNMIFYDWFFILPVPAFAICDFNGVAGALASEDWGKKVTEHLSLTYIRGNQAPVSFQRVSIFCCVYWLQISVACVWEEWESFVPLKPCLWAYWTLWKNVSNIGFINSFSGRSPQSVLV